MLLTGKSYRMAIMEKVEQLSDTLNSLSFECQPDLNQIPVLSLYETTAFIDTGSLVSLTWKASRELSSPCSRSDELACKERGFSRR